MQHRVDAIAQSLSASRWKRLSADFGSKGERLYDWASMELSKQDDWTRTLLVRRSIKEKPEYAYYLCYAPVGIDVFETLVRIAGERWQIEQCFQAAKPGSPRTGLGPWGGRANADWITTRCTIGGAGIDI